MTLKIKALAIKYLTFWAFTATAFVATPAHSQWWERGKGFQNDYIYAKAYCYARGDKLTHDQALLLAYSKDKLPEQSDKDRLARLKRIASIILNYISDSGSHEEFSGCKKAHSSELANSM